MSKRKREDDTDAPGNENENFTVKVPMKARISQGVKSLHNALKLARGFERQKLGRRQKNATSDPHTLLRLREEVIVLKQLQLEKTAKNRLLKQLAKTKRIQEHPVFIGVYGSNPVLEHVKPGAEANIVGRLFNSNPVKQVLPDILKSIYHVLGIPQAVATKLERTAKSAGQTTNEKPQLGKEDEFNGLSGDDSMDHANARYDQFSGSELEDDDMLEYARGRLASSDAESDEGVNTEVLPQRKVGRGTMNSQQMLVREDLSISPTPGEMSEPDEVRHAAQQPPKSTNKTAFLPSLSMGGYYSGSDSADDTNQYHGPALPKARKNRRGQRARQQLAELKYGEKAKHLGKKSAWWDPKRGAVSQGGYRQDRSQNRQFNQWLTEDRPSASTNLPSKPNKPNSRDDQGPIHPSWEAAKKRKMQDQGQASFQGKKITFD